MNISGLDVAVQALLDVSKEAPMIGPVVGLIKRFYDCYHIYRGNKEDILVLNKILEICMCWLNRIAPSISSSTEEVILLALNELALAVENASKAVEHLQSMFCNNSVLLGTFVATEQQKIITEQSNSLNKSLNLFLTTLSGIQSMRMLEEEKNATMKELHKILQPETFKHIIEDHLHRFQDGSREWLHSEVQEWINTDINQRLFLLLSDAGTLYCNY